jgi:hypothetical protein
MCGELSLNDDGNYDKKTATRSLFSLPFYHHDIVLCVVVILLWFGLIKVFNRFHSFPPPPRLLRDLDLLLLDCCLGKGVRENHL